MELDDLKSDFSGAGKEQISKKNLQRMLRVSNHPILKDIKIQLIFESVLWGGFLIVYYDFFDGNLRSLQWNVLLVLAVVLLLIHNLLGYRITKNAVHGNNIRISLKNYLKRIRKYSMVSIITRVMAISIIFGYFISPLEFYESRHYWSFGFLLLIIAVQTYLLWKVWSNRIKKITTAYEQIKDN